MSWGLRSQLDELRQDLSDCTDAHDRLKKSLEEIRSTDEHDSLGRAITIASKALGVTTVPFNALLCIHSESDYRDVKAENRKLREALARLIGAAENEYPDGDSKAVVAARSLLNSLRRI